MILRAGSTTCTHTCCSITHAACTIISGFTPVHTDGLYRGRGSLVDTLLGLAATMSWCGLLTLYIKTLVGRPRPNYAALMQVVAQSPSLAGKTSRLGGEPNRSYPSGHSSLSMAGMAYISCVFWSDATHSASHTHRSAWVSAVSTMSCDCILSIHVIIVTGSRQCCYTAAPCS
jgi:membrane-associated phospholipid phosphatase